MSPNNVSCDFCDRAHYSRQCKRYGSAKERMSRAQDLRLCACCLGRDHSAKSCTYGQLCRYCDGVHHDAVCSKEFRNRIAPSSCLFCRGQHLSDECTDVATVEGRKAFAKERGLCLECFRSMRNHDKTGRCSTRGGACVHCKGRHNSVLCENKFSVSERSIEKPPSSTRTPVEAPDEQLLAQQEQLYQLATLLEQEKVSLSDERDALDKLKAQLESRKVELDKEAISIEEAKQSLKAERAQIQLKRSHMEAERIHFDHQLQSLKDEQQAKRLLQLDRTLRLQKELDSLEAENERLKLSVGHSSASDSPSRSRSVPSVDGVKPCAAKRSRISFP